MLRGTAILLFYIITGSGITPITENIEIRLQGTADGPDSRGEGFAALTEHVQHWIGEDESFPSPNLGEIIETPADFRGDIFGVSGTIEVAADLRSPWEDVTELFVRDDAGMLFGLYVVGEPLPSIGSTLRTPAIFYKTMAIEGGDHQIRRYPTFVTSSAVLLPSTIHQSVPTAVLVIPALVFAFGILFVFTKSKNKKPSRTRERIQSSDVIDAVNETATELPSNSSEALAVMYEGSEDKE